MRPHAVVSLHLYKPTSQGHLHSKNTQVQDEPLGAVEALSQEMHGAGGFVNDTEMLIVGLIYLSLPFLASEAPCGLSK